MQGIAAIVHIKLYYLNVQVLNIVKACFLCAYNKSLDVTEIINFRFSMRWVE